MQCRATSKRSGQLCKRHAVAGRSVCPMHGGKTPRGAAHPRFVHGRYSQALPHRLEARYAAAQADLSLLELKDELALLDSRIADLLTRVESGESGHLWRDLRRAFSAFEDAQAHGDTTEAMAHLTRVRTLITRGYADEAAWSEVLRLIEARRKLAESERKRAVELQQNMTIEQGMALVRALVAAVERHVPDVQVRMAIGEEVDRLWLGRSEPSSELQA